MPHTDVLSASQANHGDERASPEHAPGSNRPSVISDMPQPHRGAVGGVRSLVLGLVAILLGSGSAAWVASQTEPVYAARSEILLQPGDRGGEQLRTFMATQVVIAESRATLLPIASGLNLPIDTLQRRFSAEFVTGSTVLRLQYRDPNPELAASVVQAATERYLAALRQSEAARRGVHQLLVPPFVLERPIWPQPVQVGAIGAVAGLLIAACLLVIRALRLPRS